MEPIHDQIANLKGFLTNFSPKSPRFNNASKKLIKNDFEAFLVLCENLDISISRNPENFQQLFYHLIYNIEIPKCQFCSKNAKFYRIFDPYYKTCGSKMCNDKNKFRGALESFKKKNGITGEISNISQTKNWNEKIKESNLEKYGVEWQTQSQNFKDKAKETCLEKYGEEHHLRNSKILDKQKSTNIERYGISSQLKSQEIKENGMKDKYGVRNPMQHENFFNKTYKRKPFTLPSGKIVLLQGYEHVCIHNLLKKYKEKEIFCLTKEISILTGKIMYDNNSHRYYPDIFIPKENLIIEIKSTYTMKKELEKNMKKKQACLDAGFDFEFWICSDKEIIEKQITPKS